MAKSKTIFSNSKRVKPLENQGILNIQSSVPNTNPGSVWQKPALLNQPVNNKDILNSEEDMNKKLDTLVNKSQHTLYSIKSVFPFDLFPDTLSIDVNQIHLTTKYFLKTKRMQSIAIKDISDVIVETTPWFATLKIIDKDFIDKSVQMTYLKKDDALKAKKIIQGLIISIKEGIDFSQEIDNTLIHKLEEIGSSLNINSNK